MRAGKTIKENLNEALNEKIAIVEGKRENKLKRDKRISKLPVGPERRKLIFQASTEEKAQKRKKTDFQIEEQEIHESYQLLLKVCNKNLKFLSDKTLLRSYYTIPDVKGLTFSTMHFSKLGLSS